MTVIGATRGVKLKVISLDLHKGPIIIEYEARLRRRAVKLKCGNLLYKK